MGDENLQNTARECWRSSLAYDEESTMLNVSVTWLQNTRARKNFRGSGKYMGWMDGEGGDDQTIFLIYVFLKFFPNENVKKPKKNRNHERI